MESQLGHVLLNIIYPPTSLVFWLRAYRENGKEGLKSQIGKKSGKGKGRPQGTFKPRTTI